VKFPLDNQYSYLLIGIIIIYKYFLSGGLHGYLIIGGRRKDETMETFSPRVQQIVNTLKEAGHRVTPQRLAILRELADTTSHPSVENVYAAVKSNFPTTSLATVYKTVALLKELGEAAEISFGDGSNRYDVRMPEPHPHLVCMHCRRIMDADLKPLSHLAESLAKSTGFQILSHRVDFYGVCPDCQNAADPGSSAQVEQAGR
jgi:Fur family transcriptional regulator, peroxide stress response regulator